MLACRVVCCSHQSDRRIWVSRTNQIATLGYITRTNRITAFGYLAPITAFGYLAPITAFGNCFLPTDIMELGGCAQRMT